MSSFRASILRALVSAFAKRIDIENVDFPKMRRKISKISALMPTASGVRVDVDEINGLHSEWLTPKECEDGKLLLYLHGGGYVVGGCDMHRKLVSHTTDTGTKSNDYKNCINIR